MQIDATKYEQLIKGFDKVLRDLSEARSPMIHVERVRKELPKLVKQLKSEVK